MHFPVMGLSLVLCCADMPKHAKLETSRGGVGFQSTYSLSCEGFLQAGMKLHVCLFATNDFFPPG